MNENTQDSPTTPGPITGVGEGRAMRRKYWEEMNDSEKIEALREAAYNLGRAQQIHQQALTIMEGHGHLQDGSILVRAPSILGGGYGNAISAPYGYDPIRVIRTKHERERD